MLWILQGEERDSQWLGFGWNVKFKVAASVDVKMVRGGVYGSWSVTEE